MMNNGESAVWCSRPCCNRRLEQGGGRLLEAGTGRESWPLSLTHTFTRTASLSFFPTRTLSHTHAFSLTPEREFFLDNLLVRNHLIIVMIRWTGLAPWEFEFPLLVSLTFTFLGSRETLATPTKWQRALSNQICFPKSILNCPSVLKFWVWKCFWRAQV